MWREHAGAAPEGQPYLRVQEIPDDDSDLDMWTFGFLVKETESHYHVATTASRPGPDQECSETMMVDKNSVIKEVRL
jgi:hypothetical protein